VTPTYEEWADADLLDELISLVRSEQALSVQCNDGTLAARAELLMRLSKLTLVSRPTHSG